MAVKLKRLQHSDLGQHQGEILQQLRGFWLEGQFCDVVLKSCDGTQHGAHLAVLSAASVYFKNLLSGSFLEANQVQQKQPVEIAASTTAVSALLDYIYGGQPELKLETCLELQRLAGAFDLPKLASAVEACIMVSLNHNEALQVLQESHGLHALKEACQEKVAEDFETCSQHQEFGKLSASELARILKREDLKVSREEVVLKSIFDWLNVSKDRHAFAGMLLQHVDFHSFSVENLVRISHLSLSGPLSDELNREVDRALRMRKQHRQQSTETLRDFRPKRQCLKHWSPDLGASIEASGREVLPMQCYSLCWHNGSIYATDFAGHVFCWKPGDPADSVRAVAGEGATVNGWNDLGRDCEVSISSTGEIFVLDKRSDRLVRFQDGCGHEHLVFSGSSATGMVCSPKGVVYVLTYNVDDHEFLQKLVGSTLQTVIASANLPADLQFRGGRAICATKEEVIYFTDDKEEVSRVLRVNPAESLEPVVVGQILESNVESLFVTEDGTIYAADSKKQKVLAFRPGDPSPSEVLQCPDPLRPTSVVVHDRSIYVSMVDPSIPIAGGVYEYLLPAELQLECKTGDSWGWAGICQALMSFLVDSDHLSDINTSFWIL